MNVLFLDDDDDRQRMFKGNNPGHSITQVESAFVAIRFLRESRYDVVFLDHDLDDQNTPTQDSHGTGLHVVNWLSDCIPERKPLLVVVHSVNAIQAGEMMGRLAEDGHYCLYLPHCWEWPGLVDRLKVLLPDNSIKDS